MGQFYLGWIGLVKWLTTKLFFSMFGTTNQFIAFIGSKEMKFGKQKKVFSNQILYAKICLDFFKERLTIKRSNWTTNNPHRPLINTNS